MFLAMNAHPELLEPGKLVRRVAKQGRVREFWTPNVVGPRYKLKREVPQILERQFVYAQWERGSDASPRMQWRPGHFRQQAHGVGRKERKTVWIEPALIGAKGEQ